MEYALAAIYIALGLLGGSGHWAKKRFIDETTNESFVEYLKGEPKATKKALVTIIGTEIALSLASGGVIGLSQVVSALTAGYTVDSTLNKAADQTERLEEAKK